MLKKLLNKWYEQKMCAKITKESKIENKKN